MIDRRPTRTRTSATRCATLCAQFPDEYFRKVDDAARLPRGVRRRADQGRLAGRADPAGVRRLRASGLTEASVIMEEINRSGGNAGACHGQMYNMGTLLRHGSRGAEAAVPAEDRQRRAAPAVDGA